MCKNIVHIVIFVTFFVLNSVSRDVTAEQTSVLQELTGNFRQLESIAQGAAKNCVCIDYNCGCCAHLVEREIRLDSLICANATYLRQDYGFSLTVTFNKYTVFNETMSLRNPPPVCMGAPFVEDLADVCVRMYDIQASAGHLHACVEVEAELKHIRIAKYELGCFNMGGNEIKTALEQLENEVL